MRQDAPGPGAYEVRTHGEGPQWVMGTSSRTEIVRSADSPGPGQYKYYLHGSDGQSYTMQGRYTEVVK